VQLGEAFGVAGEVAEAEGAGDEVDGGVGEGEMEGVGLDGADVAAGELGAREGEHVAGEVDGKER
jgi:hypothetical protein